MRTVAIIATVVALIGISIPFTWDTHADDSGEPITAPFIEPVAAHASALELEAQADAAACMPNAKPATDFTLPALDGKKVALSQLVRPLQGRDSRLRRAAGAIQERPRDSRALRG